MRVTRRLLRTTVLALGLAMLWVALHPAVINAVEHQGDSHRVLVCTPMGMEWVSVDEPSIEVLMGLAAPADAPADGDTMLWPAACPWCQLAQVLPAHHAQGRSALPIYQPYLAYVRPAAPSAALRSSVGQTWLPPVRAPPAPAPAPAPAQQLQAA